VSIFVAPSIIGFILRIDLLVNIEKKTDDVEDQIERIE
jgi:hypothetical protein